MTDEYFPDISEDQIFKLAEDFIVTASSLHSAMEAVVGLLHASISYYDWVGIYLLGDDGILTVGPYRGDPSPHTRIPVDKGICGAAVREKATIVVPDVSSDPRYLTCSPETRSEIAVPIMSSGIVKGEIDVDSNKLNAFNDHDRKLLEAIASKLGDMLWRRNLR